ncbi:MAG: serine/threonine-protein kinase, partial [Acidobacteria bacterium]|nr:serine/threonine-protein kinase [Acidobacteriota bacterium]
QPFTQDPQRLALFERDAQMLAQLNHPNMAAIHSFEHADDIHFLVLELVPGDTLAERLAKGPLAVEEALEVCRQIAQGAEVAHEKGVIHRDLKPANVKITPEGKVKILDFGLAKAFESETPLTDISQSPTLTEEMTKAGALLGRAAYMSPEQAKGQSVDKRADIWAFGCLLYECFTAKRVFPGETIAETLAAVLKSNPTFSAKRPQLLFEGSYQRDTDAGHPRYGVSPDGQQFVLVKVGDQAAPTQINVVLNWFEELKELVPVNP